jgi:hypothetical protein
MGESDGHVSMTALSLPVEAKSIAWLKRLSRDKKTRRDSPGD